MTILRLLLLIALAAVPGLAQIDVPLVLDEIKVVSVSNETFPDVTFSYVNGTLTYTVSGASRGFGSGTGTFTVTTPASLKALDNGADGLDIFPSVDFQLQFPHP